MSKLVFMYYHDRAPQERMRLILPAGFELEFFNPDRDYDADTVFYYDMYGPWHEWIKQHLSSGHRVIFDAKNEHYIHFTMHSVLIDFLQYPGQGCFIISGHTSIQLPGIDIIATPYWYWILDQLQFSHTGMHTIKWQHRNIKKKFFMSIGLARPDRDYVYQTLGMHLLDSLHSYQAHGIVLPDDYFDLVLQQRYINPEWMHSTACTLIVETYINQHSVTGYSLTQQNNLFLSEKSYKPAAAQHPFVMASTPGNLAYMQNQGFETFPELFDESYDNIQDWQQRVQKVVDCLSDFDQAAVSQPIVQQKLQYNQARFFDRELTKKFCNETVIEPMLKFIS